MESSAPASYQGSPLPKGLVVVAIPDEGECCIQLPLPDQRPRNARAALNALQFKNALRQRLCVDWSDVKSPPRTC